PLVALTLTHCCAIGGRPAVSFAITYTVLSLLLFIVAAIAGASRRAARLAGAQRRSNETPASGRCRAAACSQRWRPRWASGGRSGPPLLDAGGVLWRRSPGTCRRLGSQTNMVRSRYY